MTDVEDTLKRIQGQKGVTGVVIMDSLGRTIRSTLDDETSSKYSTLFHMLCEQLKNAVKELDPTNDLTFLRMRTKKHEIMIAPDKEFLIAVLYTK